MLKLLAKVAEKYAKNTNTAKERYKLDDTEFNITVTVDTTKVPAEAVTVTYAPPAKNQTWTHILYPAYDITFDFYQELVNHTTKTDMEQNYQYTFAAADGTPPMPDPTKIPFTMSGSSADDPKGQLTTKTTRNP